MEDQSKNTAKKIIHIDMDAFYASVEQRDFPEFRGKPLAVGGSPDGRGVVATASYEARVFGVKSAMSSHKALQLCPHLIFTRPRFDVYKEVSQHIREIFGRYTDLIEPLSLDEAYLDVTFDKQNIGSAIEIAKKIKEEIKTELNLTASAGISTNKFIAKTASDMNKPDGLTFIGPSKIVSFIENLRIEKFFGVGKVTAQKMKNLGIYNGADLKKLNQIQMHKYFGKTGKFFYNIVRGVDSRLVQPNRISKSVGAEDTFRIDIGDPDKLKEELYLLSIKVNKRLELKNTQGKTLTLKVKFSDFSQITRSFSFPHYFNDQETIFHTATQLLDKVELEEQKVRLLGISISNFYGTDSLGSNQQLTLF